MRPRNFLSAALIYGTIFGVGVPLLLWILGSAMGTSWPFAPLEILFMVLLFGVPAGLGFGFWLGPTTRTFNYQFSEEFKARLEASLSSIHYLPHGESPGQLTYRISPPFGGLLPVTADITVDKVTSPIRVRGPRNMLGQLEKRLRQTTVGPGGIAHNVSG